MYITKPFIGQDGYKIKYTHLNSSDNLGVLETEQEANKTMQESPHKRYCKVIKAKYNGTYWEEN